MNTITKIKVQGHLDKKWTNRFEGMSIIYEEDNTVLTGKIKDDSNMYGILNMLRDLNLKLLSVNKVDNIKEINNLKKVNHG